MTTGAARSAARLRQPVRSMAARRPSKTESSQRSAAATPPRSSARSSGSAAEPSVAPSASDLARSNPVRSPPEAITRSFSRADLQERGRGRDAPLFEFLQPGGGRAVPQVLHAHPRSAARAGHVERPDAEPRQARGGLARHAAAGLLDHQPVAERAAEAADHGGRPPRGGIAAALHHLHRRVQVQANPVRADPRGQALDLAGLHARRLRQADVAQQQDVRRDVAKLVGPRERIVGDHGALAAERQADPFPRGELAPGAG